MLIHIHIPKNAGTTVDSILKRNFGERYYDFYTDRNGKFLTQSEFIQLVKKIQPYTDVLSAHDIHPLEQETSKQLELNYFTLIRHPVERARSLYYHERRNTGKNHISQKSFHEYVQERSKEDRAISNWQTYNIGGEADFFKAKKILDNFALVGLVEKFDESLLLLREKFKKGLNKNKLINLNIFYQQQNISQSKIVTEPMGEEKTLEKLIEMNQEDLQLFEYASTRLNIEISKINNFQIQKNIFQTTNLLYNRVNQIRWSLKSLN